MEQAGLVRSMARKDYTPDNSTCEGFFGRLKNEIFYGRSLRDVTVSPFIKKVAAYIRWYNEKRIKLSLGGRSPQDYRKSLGLVS
jgi:transposase InsO family protein